MRAQAQPPRRKWPLIVIGMILAALVAYALYAIATNRPTPVPTSSSSPTPTATSVGPGEPTGCAGGSQRDAAMLIAAQESAGHSTTGAIEFATAYVRWIHQYPNPSAQDAEAAKVTFASSIQDFDLIGYLATQPNLSGGIVENGRTFYSSTVPGVWFVESESADEVTVSIGTAFVVDGQLSASLRGSITVTVVWEDGAWRFLDSEGTRTTEELFEIGESFAEGC